MAQSEAGKGSAPRKNRDDKAYNDGWDRIFGKKPKDQEPPVRTAPFGK